MLCIIFGSMSMYRCYHKKAFGGSKRNKKPTSAWYTSVVLVQPYFAYSTHTLRSWRWCWRVLPNISRHAVRHQRGVNSSYLLGQGLIWHDNNDKLSQLSYVFLWNKKKRTSEPEYKVQTGLFIISCKGKSIIDKWNSSKIEPFFHLCSKVSSLPWHFDLYLPCGWFQPCECTAER